MGIMKRMRMMLGAFVSVVVHSSFVAMEGLLLFLFPWLRVMSRVLEYQEEGDDDWDEGKDGWYNQSDMMEGDLGKQRFLVDYPFGQQVCKERRGGWPYLSAPRLLRYNTP
jgi:hypothetical protein